MRRVSVVLGALWALAAAAGVAAEIPPHPSLLRFSDLELELPDPSRHRLELPGGARLYVVEDGALPLVDVAVAVRAGSYLDPPGRAGLALLSGSLMRRAGAGHRGPAELDDAIARLGARLDSRLGETRGGVALSAVSWVSDDALELLFDVLARPRFEPELVEQSRRNLIEGMSRRNDDPLDILEREWQWRLAGSDHFSTRPPTPDSVGAITPDQLAALHRRVFRPERLIFAVSGDVDRTRLAAELGRRLAAWPRAPETAAVPWPPPAPPQSATPGLFVIDVDTPQAKVLLGHPAAASGAWSPQERAALLLMGEILGGGGAISRLSGRLRTAEGLVYRASADFDVGTLWPGDFRVFFEAESARVPRALRAAREEIERVRTTLAHPTELAVARETLLAELRLGFATAEQTAGRWAENELLGRPHHELQQTYRAIGRVSAEDVRAAARKFLRPAELVVVVVGRAAELGVAPGQRATALEDAAGQPLTLLPRRDPSTLLPLPPDDAR